MRDIVTARGDTLSRRAGPRQQMRSAGRLLCALVASTALFMVASTAAQAAWQTTSPTSSSTPYCGGVYTNIPGLGYRECIYVLSASPNGYVKSSLQVKNYTNTYRRIAGFTETIVDGRSQGRTYCPSSYLPPYASASCTESAYHFVLRGHYAYGHGCVFSGSLSGCANSPIYRPY